jgi:hypothetical protein
MNIIPMGDPAFEIHPRRERSLGSFGTSFCEASLNPLLAMNDFLFFHILFFAHELSQKGSITGLTQI